MNISREMFPPQAPQPELRCAWGHVRDPGGETHTYLVIYAPGEERLATRALSNWARDPRLNLRTAQAVYLAQQIHAFEE